MTWLVLMVLVTWQVGTQPAAEPRESGQIRGRVTDAESGQPLPRARVRLNREGDRDSMVALTDSDGQYRFTGLLPGIYHGDVEAGVFRATHLARGLGPNRPARLILKEGERVREVNVALTPSRAITVHVVDEWGKPLAGVRIMVRDARTRREVHVGYFRTTDDRGRIRVYGLDRGTYILCADHGVGATFTGITEPTRERVLPTCYPSAASFDESAPVKLEGSDVEGVEIRMRRGRTFRVTGMVLDSSGLPAESASVGINKHERLGSTGTGLKLMPGARFVLENLAPGSYSISARLGGPDRPEHRAPLEVGFAPVVVAASDIEDLVVPMSRTVDVAGSFALEDPSSVFPPTGAPLYVAARLVTDSTQRLDSSVTSIADDRLAFRLAGLFGRRVLDISNLPRGWYVKSVRYAGKDIVDVPTEFKPGGDPAALEVVLSNRGAVITGRVVDDRGEPVSAAQMIMVPADRSRWGRFDAIAGRSSATGQFGIGPRRPGDYIVLALKSGAELLDSQDVDQLAKLVGIGERVTLGELGEQTLDLQVISR